MGRIRVRAAMTQPAITISSGARFKEAAELMHAHSVSGLPVVSAEGRLVGIVTEQDLLAKEVWPVHERAGLLARLREPMRSLDRKASGRTVAEIMTSRVETARPDEELRTAAHRMAVKRVKRLPVVELGEVLGVISRSDVIAAFARPDDELARAVERFLEECLFVSPYAEIEVSASAGVVGLKGRVLSEGDLAVAEALAASVDGVVGVINGLTFNRGRTRAGTARVAG